MKSKDKDKAKWQKICVGRGGFQRMELQDKALWWWKDLEISQGCVDLLPAIFSCLQKSEVYV